MVVCIIQARMGSTRLPGKVLQSVVGKTFLEHLVNRVKVAETIGSIVVATSELVLDNPISQLCEEIGCECFRGSEKDVLDRYYQAASKYNAEIIVRITADCPLIDPWLVDDIVNFYTANNSNVDLVTNRYPLTFPDGLDVDVFSFSALEVAWNYARTDYQREHVIPFFWEEGRRVLNYESDENLFQKYRWTVDYIEDAILVKKIFEALYRSESTFSYGDVMDFLRKNPSLSKLNSKYIPPVVE